MLARCAPARSTTAGPGAAGRAMRTAATAGGFFNRRIILTCRFDGDSPATPRLGVGLPGQKTGEERGRRQRQYNHEFTHHLPPSANEPAPIEGSGAANEWNMNRTAKNRLPRNCAMPQRAAQNAPRKTESRSSGSARAAGRTKQDKFYDGLRESEMVPAEEKRTLRVRPS
jgi:hypothetical protein